MRMGVPTPAGVVLSGLMVASAAAATGVDFSEKDYGELKTVRDLWQLVLVKDNAVGYARLVIKTGALEGKPIFLMRREGAVFSPEKGGVCTLEEVCCWSKGVQPLRCSFRETTPKLRREVSAAFTSEEVVLSESVDGRAATETRLKRPKELHPEEDVYALFFDIAKEGRRTCNVIDLQEKRIKQITLDVKGLYTLEFGADDKRPALRVDSSRGDGMVFYFDPKSSNLMQASYTGTPLVVVGSGPNARKAFYASTVLTQHHAKKCRAAWKKTGRSFVNDLLGLEVPSPGAGWQEGAAAGNNVLALSSDALDAAFNVAVEHVGDAWSLEEYVDTYSKNLDERENTKVARKTKTTVGGRPAYRINYKVTMQGTPIPGLCYVTVNRAAAIMLVWAINPANATKGRSSLMRIMRGLKVKK